MECTEKPAKKVKAEPKKSDLSVDDLCRILKASEESGILKLKFQGLEFERATIVLAPNSTPTHAEHAIPEATHTKQNEHQILIEELRQKKQELDEMLITDPAQYEQLLLNGDLGPDEGIDDGADNDE